MKVDHLFLSLLSFCALETAMAQDFSEIHRNAILVDTHNDIITGSISKKLSIDGDLRGRTQTDLARLAKGGVDVQVFSIWCDGEKENPFQWANRQIDSLYALQKRNPDRLRIVKSVADLDSAVARGQLAAMSGVEGGHMIEESLEKLEALHDRGVHYLTLTWNNSVPWASSAEDESNPKYKGPKGLNDFGIKVVKKMNELGMLVDLSHVGEQTFYDAINASEKPVLVSHSNAHALCPIPRNLKDGQLKALAKNGGVVHVNFYSAFVDPAFLKRQAACYEKHRQEIDQLVGQGDSENNAKRAIRSKYKSDFEATRPPMSALIDHIDYIVRLIGIDHVGIGSDFDGISSVPKQLDDVTTYPLVTKALLEKGYTVADVNKILGGNFLRVFKANQQD